MPLCWYTAADNFGNKTTIYQSPEDGVSAWTFLIAEIYGFKTVGEFDLFALAKKYAGRGASDRDVQAYIDGWSRWSNGALRANTIIHLASNIEMLSLAKAEFAHEAGAISPLHDDQFLFGFTASIMSVPATNKKR